MNFFQLLLSLFRPGQPAASEAPAPVAQPGKPVDADQLGRLNLAALYPPFVEKLRQLVDATRATGAIYVATSGLRSYAEQDALYAKGRTAPGGVVTNARAGYSPHNFGVAVDFVLHKGQTYTGKLDPDYRDSVNKPLGQEAAKLGLEWGGTWTGLIDTPHIQLPLTSKGITWSMMRAWHDAGGIQEVWRQLDMKGPW